MPKSKPVSQLTEQPLRGDIALLGLVLAVFAAITVGPSLGLPFVGDDYVFLDQTRDASFMPLWSTATHVDFGWYRPWSRELHFWFLQKLLGANPLAFRVAGAALWIVALGAYAWLTRRLASRRVAIIATLGAAALAFWGTPLLWVSGSQDLWMLVFALTSIALFASGHPRRALVAFVPALLSKETAGVLPLLIVAYLLLARRCSARETLRRAWPFWAVLAAWAALHPTLHQRLSGQAPATAETLHRPAWFVMLLRDAAACFNLDRMPHPQELDGLAITRIALGGLVMGGAAWLLMRRSRRDSAVDGRETLSRFAAVWALIGWAPTLLPSIGWHAYYGCVGALGAWLWVALQLETRPAVAIAVISVVAWLRGMQAHTLSADWGDESYHRRAGTTLAAIHDDLLRQHPTLPAHARVYFAELPFRIGLVAGNSPALRVWYADSTVRADYYSTYRPRAATEHSGPDLFFRFDSTAGMVEAVTGDEDVPAAVARNPRWEADHDGLAALFLAKGDVARAAQEFEKLSMLASRPRSAIVAAVLRRDLGDGTRAESLLTAASARLHASPARMRDDEARARRAIARAREASR